MVGDPQRHAEYLVPGATQPADRQVGAQHRLRRDAPQLERALQHAGLNTEGGLQFSLRDQNFANREQTPQNTPTLMVPDDEPTAAEAVRRGYGRLVGLGSGIDIRV